MKRALILAGEESGVLYARQIADEARRRYPGVEIRGYGDYGFATGDLGVFGIFAVLRRIFFFMRVKRTMCRAIDEWHPEVVCTVDYPGLNLRLAAYAKARGIRTVHVVCPQVWAWHQGRIPRVEAALDRLCCFLPFEPAIFRPGFATFVGHPLGAACAAFERTGEAGRLVALLPGSRLGEITRILPTLLVSAQEVAVRFPGVRFVIPAANEKAKAAIGRIVSSADFADCSATRESIEIIDGKARELLRRATCAVVASGTATLEAALAGCPTVLVYRVGAVTAMIARRVIRGIRHVGLANVIAEKSGIECPTPELLQQDFTAARVTETICAWLADPAAREDVRAKLARATALISGAGDPIARIVDEWKV